jgi:asparagine synthase (glutamine-hydrolysing)
MTKVLQHRGPDDSGFEVSGPVGLGFRRLSILDLTPTGHQPMSTPDGQLTIVFNGEIYNYIELRKELAGRGHQFRSTGDTEVLLHAYLEWGRECLARLNGMWAFVIHDRARGVVFASRDRFGIKPLFWARTKDHVLLASEIKSIRASGLYKDETNWGVATSFLIEGRLDESNESFFRGIEQVAPGSAMEIGSDGAVETWQYWNVAAPGPREVENPAEAFAVLFEDAVRLHMRSDVPVGVNLSGGLDSTSIICASARIRQAAGATEPLLAFCYMAPEFDESAYISDTLRQSGARLVKLESNVQTLWGDLERILWYQDEPVHSLTALVGYQLMRLAADHGVKVILNGQGADETIAGYPSFFKSYWHTLLRRARGRTLWREVTEHTRAHGGDPKSIVLSQCRHLLQTRLGSFAAYRRAVERRRLEAGRRSGWFNESLIQRLPPLEQTDAWDLTSVLIGAIRRHPLPLYLRVEDRNAMAHSVEVRLPFLDHRLVELEFALPENWKLRGPWNKYVLRQGMKGRIPESVRTRVDKMGFPVPGRKWTKEALSEPVADLLGSRAARERGIYNCARILEDIGRHRKGEADCTERMLSVAQFELWAQGMPGEQLGLQGPADRAIPTSKKQAAASAQR